MASLAASLAWGLIKNHVFIDGNKRAGLAALVTFLELNGYELTCSVEEARDRTLQAAASEITEAEWTRWVEGATRPL